ncbi:hypothetical protein TNCV_4633481 [Trichonephila clavipes]|nr:hypothetical protein TNCV_4633481 [Trichonephila clavipes]
MSPYRVSCRWFVVRGSFIEAPLHAIDGVGDVDEADISTPLAVVQRAANCLKKLYGHSPPCEDHTLTSPSIVLFELFGARWSLLPNSHHCRTVPLYTSSYCVIGKSFPDQTP